MAIDYPFEFTLENGTHVVVKKQDAHHFDFSMTPTDGAATHFTYDDTVTFTSEMEDRLDFDQLNALRRFWLEREKDELG
jgi:transglutaminase/protease-like cytokinesis protein 3